MADLDKVPLVPGNYTGRVKFYQFQRRGMRRSFGFIEPEVMGAQDVYITEASFDDSVTFGDLRHVFANPHADTAQKRVSFTLEEKTYMSRDGVGVPTALVLATHVKAI